MDVILLERVDKLGQMGDIVAVKPGYARNYLLPQKKAMRATKDNLSEFDTRKTQLVAQNLERRREAEGVAGRLEGLAVVLVRQASDADQLYGSVTTRDIASAVTEAGCTIDRRQVQLNRPIKTVGLHPVRVSLHPEVTVTVTANVARSVEEAEMQARGERPSRAGEEPEEEEEALAAAEEMFEEEAAPPAAPVEEEDEAGTR